MEAMVKSMRRRCMMLSKVSDCPLGLVRWSELMYYQIVVLEAMHFDSLFDITHEEAKHKKESGRRNEALILYKKALERDFNSREDSWRNYFSVKIDYATLLKDCGLYQESQGAFYSLIQQLDPDDEQIERRVPSSEEREEQRHSCYHNFARMKAEIASNTDHLRDYEKYRRSMEFSYSYFKTAKEILISQLSRQFDKDGVYNKKWAQEYPKIKSNVLELIFSEAVNFDDAQHFDMVLEETDKVEKFVKLRGSRESETTSLFRCYYYKSVSLRQLGRYQECLNLLKEDLEYEKAHNEHEDAKKTKMQIIRTCLHLNRLKEAAKYCHNQEGRDVLQQIKEKREQMARVLGQPERIKSVPFRDIQDFIFGFFDNSQIEKYRFDYQELDRHLSVIVDQFKREPTQQALLYYYLSEANYKLKDYIKARKMIEQALRIETQCPLERRDQEIQHYVIRSMLEGEESAVERQYQKLSKDIREQLRTETGELARNQLEEQRDNLNNGHRSFEVRRKRRRQNVCYRFTSQPEMRMLSKLEEQKKGAERRHLSEAVEVEKKSVWSGSDQTVNKNHRIIRLNPEDEYAQKCKQLGLPAREPFKKVIAKQSNINPFREWLNLPLQEVDCLLGFVRLREIDLRRHHVNDRILQTLLNSANRDYVRCLKVGGTNHLSHQLLFSLISKMDLEYLSFLNFTSVKMVCPQQMGQVPVQKETSEEGQLESVVGVLGRLALTSYFPIHSLKKLKLKYCNLQDSHLHQMRLENYTSLSELSLSHNILGGSTLGVVMLIGTLRVLNLSDNPLVQLNFDSWKHRLLDYSFQFDSLKIRQVEFTQSLVRDLCPIIDKVVSIDLTASINFSLLIDALWEGVFEGSSSLTALQQLTMGKVLLSTVSVHRLTSLFQEAKRLKQVDLRGCEHNQQIGEELAHFATMNPSISFKLNSRFQSPKVHQFALVN